MNQKQIEQITLHLFVFCAASFVGIIARKVALNYGMDEFCGFITFIVSTIILMAVYLNLQIGMNQILVPLIDKVLMRFGHHPKEEEAIVAETMEEVHRIETEQKEDLTEETTSEETPSEYEQLRNKALQAKKEMELKKMDTVLSYTRETLAPHMSEEHLNRLCEHIGLFHTSPDIPKIQQPVKVESQIRTIDLMHFGWNIGNQFKKTGIQTATFIKRIFADALKDSEISTLKSKLRMEGKCIIQLKSDLQR